MKNSDPRIGNHDEHIKWLLASVKELQKGREEDRTEMKRLRNRIERMDSE